MREDEQKKENKSETKDWQIRLVSRQFSKCVNKHEYDDQESSDKVHQPEGLHEPWCPFIQIQVN